MPGSSCVFTPKEEIGLLGAMELDLERLEGRIGYVYDQAAPIGEVILGAPSAQELALRFHGRSAHAGMYPEEGRSAILAASRAIVDMPLGRIDELTSANVGLVRGGTARNIVPEWCELEAEVRSHDFDRRRRGRSADRRRRVVRGRDLRLRARDADRAEVPRLPASAPTTSRSGSPVTPSRARASSRG